MMSISSIRWQRIEHVYRHLAVLLLCVTAFGDGAYALLRAKSPAMLFVAGVVFGFCATGASQVSNMRRLQNVLRVHRRLESKYPSGIPNTDEIMEQSFSQVFFPKKLWGRAKVAFSTTLFTFLLLLIVGSALPITWLGCGVLGVFAGSMVWLLLVRAPRSRIRTSCGRY